MRLGGDLELAVAVYPRASIGGRVQRNVGRRHREKVREREGESGRQRGFSTKSYGYK